MANTKYDYDWMVIGSGFGGSVSSLRLSEKGYKVAVAERGRRYTADTLPKTAWDFRNFFWLPTLGLRGVLRLLPFKEIFVVSGSGVGGGSLIYCATLYRAPQKFFEHRQWSQLNDWGKALEPHYAMAEKMLGVSKVPFVSDGAQMLKEMGKAFGVENTFTTTPCGIYFGEPGKTVPDPYFGGEGPTRTGCTRCGACMISCREGAKNTLDKNYLWFAEKRGAQILTEHQVTDIRPLGAADGTDGYVVTTEMPGAWFNKQRREWRVRGVVVSAGAVESTRLLMQCRLTGSLPNLSHRLGTHVRTNSESILAVKLPANTPLELWRDVGNSASVFTSHDTHIEFCTYGKNGDAMASFFTLLVGRGNGLTRPIKLLGAALRHPVNFISTLIPFGWSKRTAIFLVMQSLDNAITLTGKKKWFGRGITLGSEQDKSKPAPTYIEVAAKAAQWVAQRYGGIAQSAAPEAFANIPSTSHVLGGAIIGADASQGVIDMHNRAFGYKNLLVCDGSMMPTNPGVNPSLTITALTEHAMSHVPARV